MIAESLIIFTHKKTFNESKWLCQKQMNTTVQAVRCELINISWDDI